MRVMLLNNYSMREARSLVSRGMYPAQHLYGFPVGSDTRGDIQWSMPSTSIYDVASFKRGWRQRVRTIVVRLVGDPLQQLAALRDRPDIVFSADQWSARSLLVLRRVRLLRSKTLVLVHHPPRTRFERWIIQSADRRVFLSEHTRDSVRGGGKVLPWGPDLDAVIYREAASTRIDEALDFIAAGKTNRAYDGLAAAALIAGMHGVIYDERGRTEYQAGSSETSSGMSTYPIILRDMAAARSVIIPLRDGNVMSGLTEVADAIALDKPVLITPAKALPEQVATALAGGLAGTSAEAVIDAVNRLRALDWQKPSGLHETHNLELYTAALDMALTNLHTDRVEG